MIIPQLLDQLPVIVSPVPYPILTSLQELRVLLFNLSQELVGPGNLRPRCPRNAKPNRKLILSIRYQVQLVPKPALYLLPYRPILPLPPVLLCSPISIYIPPPVFFLLLLAAPLLPLGVGVYRLPIYHQMLPQVRQLLC